jgi:demethylmenaquinone methyltransferase/2-methoxy-6-polyprenyl-1,4-benzoquinol methylase
MAVPIRRRAAPDRDAALTQYRRRAALYDAELALFEPLRRRAIAALAAAPGETVLDLGCGTGLSLPLLRAGVGAQGRVIGIEQSPEMVAHARARVDAAGWRNVDLHECPVERAPPLPRADAVLLHFTHDVLQRADAVQRIIETAGPGTRIVACGLKWAPLRRWPLNGLVAIAALHSVTTFDSLAAPWQRLAARLGPARVESLLGGAAYLAHWHLPGVGPVAPQGTSTAAPSKRPARRSSSARFASRRA